MKLILWTMSICLTQMVFANCENSHFNLIEISHTQSGVELYTQLTIGSGTNGNIKGAENGTGSFTFAFYTKDNAPLKTFEPKRVVGKNTSCVNSGVLHMAGFNGASQMLSYSSNECKFTCVNSQIKCGTMQLEVYNFKFVFDDIPDSIRVFGIEGNGNPFAGCYNSENMILNFATSDLSFKGSRKVNRNSSVELIWSVKPRALTKEFVVFRKSEEGEFNKISKVVPQFGNSKDIIYSYLDNDLIPGKYIYKIKHIDWMQNEQDSEEMLVNIEANSLMISANSSSGWIDVKLKKKRPSEIKLYNFDLDEVNSEMRLYKGNLKISSEGLLPGIYHLKTSYKEDYIITKLVLL